jgi:hypothetical protein
MQQQRFKLILDEIVMQTFFERKMSQKRRLEIFEFDSFRQTKSRFSFFAADHIAWLKFLYDACRNSQSPA